MSPSPYLVLSSPRAGKTDCENRPNLFPALAQDVAKQKVDKSVQLIFGKTPAAGSFKPLGTIVSNPKTNGFNKGDEEGCNWVFVSAVLELQSRARALGADAIVDVVSYYKKNVYSNTEKFECANGAFVSAVALRGVAVKLGHN